MSALTDFRQKHGLPDNWKPGTLWDVVKDIIRDNSELLAGEDLRSSYYIVRDLLDPKIGLELTEEQYNWFLTSQGYSSYSHDVWTQMEQREGLSRPRAKAEGWFYDRDSKMPIENLPQAWGQIRGWIFVEKSEEAANISELSKYGWGIVVAGKGFPTRLIRKLLKDEDKPVLIFHDADQAGTLINDVFGEGSRRTTHLDILIDRAIDIGLDWDDVVALDLPTQPEPPKYGGEPRAEISSLRVLKLRLGIANPTLEYIKLKMLQHDITIAPTEVDVGILFRSRAELEVMHALRHYVSEYVDDYIDVHQDEFRGSAVRSIYPGDIIEDVVDVIDREWVFEMVDIVRYNVKYRTEEDVHNRVKRSVNETLKETMGVSI